MDRGWRWREYSCHMRISVILHPSPAGRSPHIMVIATHSDRLSALTNPMAWAHAQGPSACAHLGLYGSAQGVLKSEGWRPRRLKRYAGKKN